MARIVVGSWMVRYPLGGNLSWTLQWLVGLQRLGHEVYLVEKAGYPQSCFDPSRNIMTDDCAFGVGAVGDLLSRFGLDRCWCYVDAHGDFHGLSRAALGRALQRTDAFIDIGSHGAWLEEMSHVPVRVLVDGEPGSTQMKMEKKLAAGARLDDYDFYYTNGANVGTARSTAPVAGREWRGLFNPVVVDLFDAVVPPPAAPFTTVMNWQAHPLLEFGGKAYGQKDVEFVKFMSLPKRVDGGLEIAVAGKVPGDELLEAGWHVRPAHAISATYDSYVDYISRSAGEFSVAKHVYVETCTGWFSDRSAAYLASGRPVVLQETGFSAHLPCGKGLFAVRSADEAADAIDQVRRNFATHSLWARRIAVEYLDARILLSRFLTELGI